MEPVAVLVGVEGALAGTSVEITATGLRLGREPGNELCIDDAGVSRQHARVILHNGAVWVQDAGSRNGVFVNAERVADHRQLKPGDRITVGAHAFEVRLMNPAQASAPPGPTPSGARLHARTVAQEVGVDAEAPKKWKLWPFAVAIGFTLGCIGCFGVLGALRSPEGEAAASPASGPSYSLATVLPQEGSKAPAAPALSDVLAVAAGTDAESKRAALPDAPAGATSASLVERGHALYETGRLNEARTAYQQALKIDQACAICTVRIERLDLEIRAKAESQLDAGVRYYDSMQVPQAIAAWETVLMLVPEPTDPIHLRAAESLARARAGTR